MALQATTQEQLRVRTIRREGWGTTQMLLQLQNLKVMLIIPSICKALKCLLLGRRIWVWKMDVVLGEGMCRFQESLESL